MIGSFWNLCRACPSMPVDKLHSEYRSTYRWHEFSGPEVVRKPPVPNQFANNAVNEPPLPRRKKNPELAYRSHEFIGGLDRTDSTNRARSGERGTPSRRSKSEGPPAIPNGRCISGIVGGAGVDDHGGKQTGKAGESNGLFRKTIEKLSTEYRLQFVWPNVRRAIKGGSAERADPPRKSISMGAIKSAHTYNIPTVHKKRTTNEKEAAAYELEPLFRDEPDTKHEKRHVRPNYQFDKEKFGFEPDGTQIKGDKSMPNGYIGANDRAWVKEVLELRKKAGEYKTRAWGVEINPDLVKKQAEVFDQISRRSSLSALSLDTSIRPIQNGKKEEINKKDEKPPRPRVPGQARPVGAERSVPDGLLIRAKLDNVRYHLGKPIDDDDIALLISPTREKLMPAIPKGSPQKTAKTISPKSSPKKRVKVRSQSVGPTVSDRSGSPKKQIRSGSTVSSASAKAHKKTPVQTPTITGPSDNRRPRPTDDDNDPTTTTTTNTGPLPHPDVEHIIKSPPEPTRVKSPEQILMRSPDPVNWTVPLDTGKTFTVTQNVREGDTSIRPHSELKAGTPVGNAPFLATASAPPSLEDQSKLMTTSVMQLKPEPAPTTLTSINLAPTTSTATNAAALTSTSKPAVPETKFDKPIPGSTIRCLDDPAFAADINSPLPSTGRPLAATSEVIEEARDRFDRYWSKPSTEDDVTKSTNK